MTTKKDKVKKEEYIKEYTKKLKEKIKESKEKIRSYKNQINLFKKSIRSDLDLILTLKKYKDSLLNTVFLNYK